MFADSVLTLAWVLRDGILLKPRSEAAAPSIKATLVHELQILYPWEMQNSIIKAAWPMNSLRGGILNQWPGVHNHF